MAFRESVFRVGRWWLDDLSLMGRISFNPEPAATGYGAKTSLCVATTCMVFLRSM